MSAKSFGFTNKLFFSFIATIASNVTSYNIYNAAIAAGWNGTTPLNSIITINAGVTVSGTGDQLDSALIINGIPTKSIVTINNNGTIVGVAGQYGYSTSNSGAPSYPGNPTSVPSRNYTNGYDGSGYPTGPGAGGSTPGDNYFSGGTSPNGGAGTTGGTALYLRANATVTVNNGATGIFVGGGGGAGGQAGNNAGGGSGANGGYLIDEAGSHPAVIANNTLGGIIASGGGGSGGWGNRATNDGIGGRPGYAATNYLPSGSSGGNYGGNGISPGLATNNTGTTLVNTTGTFTLSPAA
jgi:hypothetical protein